MKKELINVEEGKDVKVVEIQGGHGLKKRLESIGIIPDVIIRKISNQVMKGPVVIKVGTTQVAIGYGMARKIIVEEIESKDEEY